MVNTACSHEIIKTKTEGTFIFGDAILCAEELLGKYRGKITLIYLDPPFCTGNDFRIGNISAYQDRMNAAEYMQMMRTILLYSHELLSEEGSLYLHIDYRMSAKLRLLLDEIFGEQNMRNEIIWAYNSGGRAKRYFSHKHDTIFFYSKTDKYYFDIEATGIVRGSKRRNNMKRNTDENGLVYYSVNSNGKEYRYYETDLIYPTDVWTDIEHLHQRDKERTSYPTQKPLALLERIIKASSYEGAYVLDFFSGSGTTATAAAMLGRRWIATDKSPLALLSLKKRLPAGYADSHILYKNLPNSIQISNLSDINQDELFFVSGGILQDGIYKEATGSNVYLFATPTNHKAICLGDKEGRISFFEMN